MTVLCARGMYVKRIRIQSTSHTICINAGETYIQLSGMMFYITYTKIFIILGVECELVRGKKTDWYRCNFIFVSINLVVIFCYKENMGSY